MLKTYPVLKNSEMDPRNQREILGKFFWNLSWMKKNRGVMQQRRGPEPANFRELFLHKRFSWVWQAGLFSAVVTTFIVESYKSLQPDLNDAIINLLSHIATRLDGPSMNSTSTVISPVAQSFSPTPSSIRVNIFWFTSLVLSLTTVLVGIIALQWLREHQSYSTNFKSQEKYALCIMRANGIDNWHVSTIFTYLPLFLQGALVLFLGGIIDFLHAIGH